MTQKKNRSSTASTKSNGSVASTEKKIVAKKRQREEDSEDEIEQTEAEMQRVKKLKQMLADAGDNEHSSEEDDEDVDEASDDDEEDSDEDDEDYDDEDDSEHEGDTEEEFPEKIVTPKMAGDKKKKKQTPDKANDSAKKEAVESKAKVISKITEPFKPSTSNVMLFNIPKINETELKGFLSKRNVNPESICCINGPVAMLGFGNEAAAKKALTSCSGASYNQTMLAAIAVSGEDLAMIKSNKNPNPCKGDAPLTCLFVTDIPKPVSEEELVKATGITPKHVRLITSGPKNRLTNACYIDCKSEADAKKALQSLPKYNFAGKSVKVFLKPQFNFNPVTENSVIVANVPFSADIEDIKKEFPKALKVELTRRGCFMLTFENAEIRDKVVKESKGKILDGRELRYITTEKTHCDVAVFVSNVSYNVTLEELKAAFPGCKNVFMKKKNGKFYGNAIVYYNNKEEAEAGAKQAADKEIKGRALKVKMTSTEPKGESETPKKESKISAKKEAEQSAEATQKSKKPVQVGSDSESDEEDDVKEDDSGSDDSDEQDDDEEEEEDEDENGDDESEEETEMPTEQKRAKMDTSETRSQNSRPSFNARGRGNGDFRGGGFRGGNRGGGGFRGNNRGGGGFRGGRGRGGNRGRGSFKN